MTWNIIPEFHDYEASNDGRIRRIWSRWSKELKPCTLRNGYLKVTLRRNMTEQKSLLVHRLVCSAFLGPIPFGMQVNHINGVKTDNNLQNLELVTPQGNTQHRIAVLCQQPVHPGTGEKHHSAKLTEANVLEIRRRFASGEKACNISNDFHIGRASIYPIVQRRTWKHI